MFKSIRILKIAIAACVFTALFMAYQIPFGPVQLGFKLFFLALGIVLMVLVLNFKSEAPKRTLNLVLLGIMILTFVMYFFEKP